MHSSNWQKNYNIINTIFNLGLNGTTNVIIIHMILALCYRGWAGIDTNTSPLARGQ